jgi:glycosyltransferase involved in cell wall biosynthesis
VRQHQFLYIVEARVPQTHLGIFLVDDGKLLQIWHKPAIEFKLFLNHVLFLRFEIEFFIKWEIFLFFFHNWSNVHKVWANLIAIDLFIRKILVRIQNLVFNISQVYLFILHFLRKQDGILLFARTELFGHNRLFFTFLASLVYGIQIEL